MVMANPDITYINVKARKIDDILDRMAFAVNTIKSAGYKVISIGCSSKTFVEISKRFAQKLGYLEIQQFIFEGTLLKNDKALLYNKEKEFYVTIIEPKTQKTGIVFPTF